jgi:hypothetical protein
MVMVDWRNTGSTPVGAVFANIAVLDQSGARMMMSADDYCVFAAATDAEKVRPGVQYVEPEGNGYAVVSVPPEGAPSRVEVSVSRVQETSALQRNLTED